MPLMVILMTFPMTVTTDTDLDELESRVRELEEQLEAARNKLEQARQGEAAIEAHAHEAKEVATITVDSVSEDTVNEDDSKPSFRTGGASRVNYVIGDYGKSTGGPSRAQGDNGNFELDTFRVNLYYRQGPALGKAEYRFYDGYHFIHTGGLSTLCRRHRSAQAFPLRWYC